MDQTPEPRMSRDRRAVNCAKKSIWNALAVAALYLPTHWTTEAMVEMPE